MRRGVRDAGDQPLRGHRAVLCAGTGTHSGHHRATLATSAAGRISLAHRAVYRPCGFPCSTASIVRKCAVPAWSTISTVFFTTRVASSGAGSRCFAVLVLRCRIGVPGSRGTGRALGVTRRGSAPRPAPDRKYQRGNVRYAASSGRARWQVAPNCGRSAGSHWRSTTASRSSTAVPVVQCALVRSVSPSVTRGHLPFGLGAARPGCVRGDRGQAASDVAPFRWRHNGSVRAEYATDSAIITIRTLLLEYSSCLVLRVIRLGLCPWSDTLLACPPRLPSTACS